MGDAGRKDGRRATERRTDGRTEWHRTTVTVGEF
jgi:hypothetical protein